jgi:NitT/TauT family transport system ATP-binding protein
MTRRKKDVPMPWEPLPHAPLGMVLGLLEHLREAPGGREDLYKLGGPLGYELDDLLPVTEAAKRLSLVRIQEGDIELTPEGRAMAAAEEPARKDLIRSRVAALPLVQAIRDAIAGAANGRVPRGAFVERLEEQFSPAEAGRQLDTALDWARYGEVFDFDPDTEEFVAAS